MADLSAGIVADDTLMVAQVRLVGPSSEVLQKRQKLSSAHDFHDRSSHDTAEHLMDVCAHQLIHNASCNGKVPAKKSPR